MLSSQSGGGYNRLVISNISASYRGLRKEYRGFLHACMNNIQTTHKTMELNKKELYLSPEVKTVEVKIVGVVCQSIPATMDATIDELPWVEETL